MLLRRVQIAALAVVAMVATESASQVRSPGRPWPPPIQKRHPAAPALPPAEALATFSMPPGYRLELVASEPLIQDPILIDWDSRSRMWAIELPGYMRDMQATGEYEPNGRIVILEDTDEDGVMDTRTVFADGFVQPRGLRVLERGVLIGDPPDVWLLKDIDGDMRADAKERVASGYGQRETNVEVNANGLFWALDNRIYASGTGADLYFRFKNGHLESHPSLSRGQWGISQDDAGRIYRNHNESVLHVDLVPTPYFARNPNLLRTRGSHERVIDPDGDINAVWPARETPGTNRAYQHGILRGDGTLAAFTAACAPTVYRGDRLPSDLYGNVFVAEPAANLVSRIILNDDGTTLSGRKAYQRAEFLTSTDERFRPVHLSNAPDGTLYIVDLYRGIIQHRAYITEYLRDQIIARKLEQPIGLVRIYRVVHDTTRRDTSPGPAALTGTKLVDTLSHPNGWRRDEAQHLLVERGDRSVAPMLGGLARSDRDWRTRLHALWTLDGLDALDPALVIGALTASSREVRTAAIRLAERWLPDPDGRLAEAVVRRLHDPDWAVRQQLAASLGTLPQGQREDALAALLESHPHDAIIQDAALSGLRGREAVFLERLLKGSRGKTHLEAVTAMLAATVIRAGADTDIQSMVSRAAEDDSASWQASALLRGAEIALLGATMPGTAPRQQAPSVGGAPPCPTCPGGRAGPGGAYAFRKPADAPAGNASARGGPILRLQREPQGLLTLATRAGDLAARARHLLTRLTWPGKAGPLPTGPSLTPDEQQRFDAGRQLYQTTCQACHQADGRGQERLAPPLIGSALALADPEVPIRILVNGKEGPTGLMPPLGSTLTDDQIASVLTYVRREWGQTGSAVEPGTVKAVRALTAGRDRPWTHDELMALIGGRSSRHP